MKNWNEVKYGDIVYMKDEIKVYSDNVICIGKTKPYQKATIEYSDNDGVSIIIDEGEFEGFDFYFGKSNNSSPKELLTIKEYNLINEEELNKKLDEIIKDVYTKQRKYLIIFETEEDESIILDIDENINRPNNPTDDEIIQDYIEYNYGVCDYSLIQLDNIKSFRIK